MSTVQAWEFPPTHDWQTKIDNFLFLGKLSCFTDNFSGWETLLAMGIEGNVNYTETLNAYSTGGKTSVPTTIKKYNVGCVQAAQSAYNTFSQTVLNLKDTEVQEKTWTETIDQAAAVARKAATDAIDTAAAKAKEYINTLPEGTRASAANLFVAGTKVVLSFFATVWSKMKEILDSIWQFIKGIWDQVTSAAGAIIAAANLAVRYITGGGGYESVALPEIDMNTLRAHPRKYDIVVPPTKA
ncbi:hypothetical protein DL769_008495 [Monosporascus sp. CRB-8-3]|nr:hypothetical protein DL769_008495 [Monosporascus sp. CRB-8-3]